MGITWDGSSYWVTDNSSTIFQLSPSGDPLDSVSSPDPTPQGITWAGSSFFVKTTNFGLIYNFDIVGGNVHVIRSFEAPGDVCCPNDDMSWDGTNLWFGDQFKVYRLSPTGDVLSQFTLLSDVTGIEWDGTQLWIAHGTVLKRVTTTGAVLQTYSTALRIEGLTWVDGKLIALGGPNPFDLAVYRLEIPQARGSAPSSPPLRMPTLGLLGYLARLPGTATR